MSKDLQGVGHGLFHNTTNTWHMPGKIEDIQKKTEPAQPATQLRFKLGTS
jgi:hypothetical protein